MTPRNRCLAARLAYVGIVLLATLSELHFSPDLAAAGDRLAHAVTPSLGWRDAIDSLRNLALFGGLGAIWVVTALEAEVRRDVGRATLVGFGLGALVEGLQLFSPVRIASVVDVTSATLGAFGGAVGVAALMVLVQRAKGARSYLGIPTFLFAAGYAGGVVCEALTPLFRSEPLAGVTGGPLERLHAALQAAVPLAWSEVPLLDLVLFPPATFLTVMLWSEYGRPGKRTWPVVAIAGALLAPALELAHGMLGLPVRWESAAIHALALAGGAWAAGTALTPLSQELRGAARARAALFAWAGLLLLWGWRPLVPETHATVIAAQITRERFVPLASLVQRVDAFSALHVAQQFLLYLPLGSLLAVWPLRLRGPLSRLKPGLWLAAVIELGHFVIVGRTFDVTNALVAWAGLAIGWIVVRRSGFAPYGAALPTR